MTRRVRPVEFYDRERGVYVVTEGIASTGEVSPLGTVSHIEYKADSGRCDARVNPRTIRIRIGPDGEVIR